MPPWCIVGQEEGIPMTMPSHIDEKAVVLKRFRRIEGQVRGPQRMVEEDAYCINILDDHLNHCVVNPVAAGGQGADDKINEATAVIARMVRS